MNKASSLDVEYVTGYFQHDVLIVSISCSSLENCIDSEKILEYLKQKIENMKLSKLDLDLVKRQQQIAMAYKKDDIEQISKYIGWMLLSGYSVDQIQTIDDVMQSITIDECCSALGEVLNSDPIAICRITPKGYDRD
jgi:predicted Zn-dependent peptidase